MRFGNGIGSSFASPLQHSTPFGDEVVAIEDLTDEAEQQGCDITFAHYPNRDVLVIGLNGTFDIDRIIDRAEHDTLLDVLTPIEETDYDDLRGDIAADHLFAYEIDPLAPRQTVRAWMDAGEHSENTLNYYELADGDILHERTYHPYDPETHPTPSVGPNNDIEQKLEDADIDVDEIIEELEEDEDESETSDSAASADGSPF